MEGKNDVKFNEWRSPEEYKKHKIPKIIMFLIKHSGGRIVNEKEASYVLLGLIGVMFIISAILFLISGPKSPSNEIIILPEESVGNEEYGR